MPPAKTRGGTAGKRVASSKPQLKTIKKTPRARCMKIPAEALSTPLTPGWTRGTPKLFSVLDLGTGDETDPFENRRMTRRSSIFWTRQMINEKSGAAVSFVKTKRPAVIGSVKVIGEKSSPVLTRTRHHASVYIQSAKSSKSTKKKSKPEAGIEENKTTNKNSMTEVNQSAKKKISEAKKKAQKSPKMPSVEKPVRLKTGQVSSKHSPILSSASKVLRAEKKAQKSAESGPMKHAASKKSARNTSPATPEQHEQVRLTTKLTNVHHQGENVSPSVTLNKLSLNMANKSAEKGKSMMSIAQKSDEESIQAKRSSMSRKSLGRIARSVAELSQTPQNKRSLPKQSIHQTPNITKDLSPVVVVSNMVSSVKKHSEKKAKTQKMSASKTNDVIEESSISIKSARKRTLLADDSTDAVSFRKVLKHPKDKENIPKSVEFVSPVPAVTKSVKVAKVKKVSMMTPDVGSPLGTAPQSAKRKIVKTPFKAAKMLGKSESPTGTTPQKAARILGKLSAENSKQLLTSTPLRSARKRRAEDRDPVSEISKRLQPVDPEESIVLESMVVSNVVSPSGLLSDEASCATLNGRGQREDTAVAGWWGWICQIL